ncbi:conserved hypothetical protein [Vibrio nigripulchritudo MADA3029]|uniref:hypothetical protein n=1 Tax=Vibrio nigripulchritudo TaxID=28173 RepID=UPI0003B1DF1F|nr:hypothetical protein [Vibrio nigripulchritudo]CCN48937.1 conserved hypothetical protein [Vibrio nigripulchritudo MADA3020]CCN53223.1 conserved hypothetical protein [Vibrio nigripulchritudo MADA3021]CCN56825.1 conserved hypothetical protein [Vibrio nigripulchritudo MADA3029]
MPLLVLLPVVAGGVGFGAGVWTGSGAGKLVKWGVIGGGAYLAYRVAKEVRA